MLFNSLEFLLFFGITSVLYFVVPSKYQKHFLLISSIVFYSFAILWHVLLLVFIVTLNYYYGITVDTKTTTARNKYLTGIISINIFTLFVFKYFNFFNANLSGFAKAIGWNYSIGMLDLVLPLGISFFIFKCISYDIEVFRKNIPAEKEFSIFALYIFIYPELLAGPIDRPKNLIEQLRLPHNFDYARISNGLKLMAWGFFQKWVIADRLAVLVNSVYDHPYENKGLSFVIATFFFAIQIYCDFSAYSDIAIGAGEVLGLRFMKNFNRPYFAKSVSEFWLRWHISLSTWFRDYLFLPLAYSTLRKLNNKPFLKIKPEYWAYFLGTLITMFIAGFWHGANWTFIIWGSLVGIYLIVSFSTKKMRKRLVRIFRLKKFSFIHKVFSVVITFSLICFAWIFFRANNINDALYIIQHLHTGFGMYAGKIITGLKIFNFSGVLEPLYLGFNSMEFWLSIIFVSFLFIINLIQRKNSIRMLLLKRPLLIRWAIYLIFIFILLMYGRFENRQFIYLQF